MTGGATGHDLLIAGTAAIIAAVAPIVASTWLRARKSAALIRDLVLGDRSRGIPPIRELIESRTRPIQPDTNGGSSLKDLHAKVDALNRKVDTTNQRVEEHVVAAEATKDALWAAINEINGKPSPPREAD